MHTLAVEKPDAASGNIFNSVSDRAVTLDGMAKLCAQAAGRSVNIVHYDLKAFGIDERKLSLSHFYAEPRAAKTILGWSSTTNLVEDLERFEEYVKIGRDNKEIKFELIRFWSRLRSQRLSDQLKGVGGKTSLKMQ
ncbi:hypothetical protein RJ641_030354, partial [Dillenia turbinata]